MLPEDRTFLIRGEDGQEYGPVGLEELREWVQENRAGLGTQARLDEPGERWHPWQSHPELVALLAEVRVTSPVPGDSSLVLAPIWRRILAGFLDFMLLSFLLVPFKFVLDRFLPMDAILQAPLNPALLQRLPAPLLHQLFLIEIVAHVCLILYFTGFHAAHGKTPAQAILRIRVVDRNGNKPNLGRAFLRAVLLICSINLYFIPLFLAFFTPRRQAFHDFMVGTCVVEA